MKNSLFSVIILHYNQPRYIFTAIDSLLNQNYENIELVFADDCSTSINLPKIQKYIEENKKDNIKNVELCINEENLGTVKTINRAVKMCHGEHILFFAGDDALANKNTIKNFVAAFENVDDDVYMVSSQCMLMDINLEEKISNFVHPTRGTSFNNMSSQEQFSVFCKSCFLAIGATAMKKEMFEKYGYFNENYKFIEDWSYFLHLTRNGGRINYIDFEGLLHRDGGVSHYVSNDELPPHVMAYKYDMVKIFENEILPFIKCFDSNKKMKILQWYESEKSSYYKFGGEGKSLTAPELVLMFPNFYIQTFIYPITKDWKWVVSLLKTILFLEMICFGAVFVQPSYNSVLFDFYKAFCNIFKTGTLIIVALLFIGVIIKLVLISLRFVKKHIKELFNK